MSKAKWQTLWIVVGGLAIGGCSPAVTELQQEITGLKTQLGQVTMDLDTCRLTLKEKQDLNTVLTKEKLSKDQDLSRLRTVYREFINGQYQSLDGLLHNVELLDYFGGEIIAREKDQGSDVTLVLQQPVPANGRVLRVRANVAYRTRLQLLIFKQLEKELLCVYASEPLDIDDVGNSEMVELPVPVHVQQGDFLGFYFPERIGVFYDENTGNYSVYKSPGRVGERIKIGKAENEKRNYSLGILAALE